MSLDTVARDDDHFRLVEEFCALISRFWTGGNRMQTNPMFSSKAA